MAEGNISSVRMALRPVSLSREGSLLRVAFPPALIGDLVPRVKRLPFAAFDGDTRTWTVPLYRETLESLRGWHRDGLCDPSPDRLLTDGEQLTAAPPAVLRPGSAARPFLAAPAWRDDRLAARLRAVPTARWERRAAAWSYAPPAAAALAELADNQVLQDPDRLLRPAEVTVMFDARTGQFRVYADDGQQEAQNVFDAAFPGRDVVAAWRRNGIDVACADPFTAEVYAGEVARCGDGLQPGGFGVDLLPYQRRDVAVALARSGLGVFLPPGLGKTVEAVAVGYERLRRGDVERVVAVVPAAVLSQWEHEIVSGAGTDRLVVVRGTPAQRRSLYAAAADADWMLVSWGVILPRYDLDDIMALTGGALLILDEAHRAKTPKTATTAAARKLARRAACRLALTGTPVENDPGEWYAVLGQLAVPDAFGDPLSFLTRYQYPGRFGGFEGGRNLDELRRRSAPHLVRHTKAQVAGHLPPLQVATRRVDPDRRYRLLLNKVHRQARSEIADRAPRAPAGSADPDEDGTGADLTAVGMLRLLCCSPRLIANSDAPSAQALVDAGLVPDDDGPKMQWLRRAARELQRTADRRTAEQPGTADPNTVAGERMVVFCSSQRMVRLAADRLGADGIPCVVYDGQTSAAERSAAVDAFTDPDADVRMFLATDAAAEGLNLGRCCQQLVNLDLAWTPGRMVQRANRIHRVDGTAGWYQVINVIVAGTVEDGILRRLDLKADLSDALFGERGGRAATTGVRRRIRVVDDALADWDG